MEDENIDFRYETKSESRDFHSRRRAFLIYQEKLYFITKGSSMSHWEFFKRKFPELTKEDFNQITRGYYLEGDLVFYKNNFTYDDETIAEALIYVNDIKKVLGIKSVKIYFGLIVGIPGEEWLKNYYYGESFPDNTIIKN